MEQVPTMPESNAQEDEAKIQKIAAAVQTAGGRALIVGGSVRDQQLGRPSRDIDIEVLGLDLNQLEKALSDLGRTHRVGRDFKVLKLSGLEIDLSVAEQTDLSFEEAALRRDLTLNSMGLDPITGELLDPHSGQSDLKKGILRATDPKRFGEDPLRILRVARMASEFKMTVDHDLRRLCEKQDLKDVAVERIFSELSKLLIETGEPSRGLHFLEETKALRFFPELDALRGVPQDPEWHPEGDVWIHTTLSVDCAAQIDKNEREAPPLMWSALCHDLGKSEQTTEVDGRIRSIGHDRKSAEISQRFLERLCAPNELNRQVAALVRDHLAPALFVSNPAGPRGYRRLARRLGSSGVNLQLLEKLARADHWGRTTNDAQKRIFPAGDQFLEQAHTFSVALQPIPDAVHGRHLIAHGLQPGKKFGEILDRCRAIQDETGETDPQVILNQVLPS